MSEVPGLVRWALRAWSGEECEAGSARVPYVELLVESVDVTRLHPL